MLVWFAPFVLLVHDSTLHVSHANGFTWCRCGRWRSHCGSVRACGVMWMRTRRVGCATQGTGHSPSTSNNGVTSYDRHVSQHQTNDIYFDVVYSYQLP